MLLTLVSSCRSAFSIKDPRQIPVPWEFRVRPRIYKRGQESIERETQEIKRPEVYRESAVRRMTRMSAVRERRGWTFGVSA